MADKRPSTFHKRMAKRGLTVDRNVDIAQKKVAIAINEQVVIHTPVLTGKARGGWVAGDGSNRKTGEDKGGSFTVAMNNARIARTRAGATIYIINDVGHIGLLNEGRSRQEAAGFVQRAMKTGMRVFAGLQSIWNKQTL